MSYKNNIFQFIKYLGTISIVQVLMVSVVMGQYLDQVNVTGNKMEYTNNYKEVNGSLYSVSSIFGDSVNQLGYNYIEFKKYNENFEPDLTTYYFDTVSYYTLFYGLEYFKGNYYSCGVKHSIASPDTLIGCVIKWDTLGSVLWEKNYFTDTEEVRIGYIASDDSSLYLACNMRNPNGTGELNSKIFAIDSMGGVQWEKDFLGNEESPLSLRETSDKGLIFSTSSQATADIKTRVYKLDSLHNIKWSKVLGPSTKDHYLQFLELPNGNYLGVGHSEEPITGYTRSWLVELGKDYGQLVKDTVYWFTPRFSVFNIYSNIIFKQDEIILNGVLNDAANGNDYPYKATIVSMDYNYQVNWVRNYYNRINDQYFLNMYEKENFYYLQGMVYQDSSTNTNDEWFLVVDSLGCTVQGCSVGITEQEEHNQQMSVYPNPSNGSFTIVLDAALPSGEVVITDLSGKQVYSQNTTSATTFIDLHQSPGIYLIHLKENGTRIQTEKLILVE